MLNSLLIIKQLYFLYPIQKKRKNPNPNNVLLSFIRLNKVDAEEVTDSQRQQAKQVQPQLRLLQYNPCLKIIIRGIFPIEIWIRLHHMDQNLEG